MSQSTPSDPFAQAEMQMKQQMAAAVRVTPSQTWVAKMIEHHRGATQMSEALMAMGGDPTALEFSDSFAA